MATPFKTRLRPPQGEEETLMLRSLRPSPSYLILRRAKLASRRRGGLLKTGGSFSKRFFDRLYFPAAFPYIGRTPARSAAH